MGNENKIVINNVNTRVETAMNNLVATSILANSYGFGTYLPTTYVSPLFFGTNTDNLIRSINGIQYMIFTYTFYLLDGIGDSGTLENLQSLINSLETSYGDYIKIEQVDSDGTGGSFLSKGYRITGVQWRFLLSDIVNPDGDSGCCDILKVQGPDGDSAYQVWLNSGHTGTEEDFFRYISAGTSGTSGTSGSSGSAGTSGTSADVYTFPSDLTVSLSGVKTFGKYANGSTIPATGKTPAQVIQMAIVEAINPTVTLTSSTVIAFNQTAISNVLNFSYTINSLGATVSTVLLEWRRNNTGSWTSLDTNIMDTTYTHSLTDSNFNTQPFNYRYTVTDTAGGTATITKDIIPVAYAAPTISFTVTGATVTTPETNAKREKGNISSNIAGTITRNSPNVALTSYVIEYQVNGTGSFIDIGSPVSIGPGTSSISSTNHNDNSLNGSTSLVYRIKVIDDYQTSISSFVTSSNSTISFLNLIFYGPVSTIPSTSANVRNLPSRIFIDGSNPFILNTGTTTVNFTAAMPATISITQVLDNTALGADITSNYILSTFNVQDFSGSNVSYHVYTLTNSIPYPANHLHQITRA